MSRGVQLPGVVVSADFIIPAHAQIEAVAGGAGRITGSFLDEHAPWTLVEYGDRAGNRAVFKRLGYIVEALGRDAPGLVEACRDRVSAGVSALDPDGPEGGRRTMRWGLRVNVAVVPQEPT